MAGAIHLGPFAFPATFLGAEAALDFSGAGRAEERSVTVRDVVVAPRVERDECDPDAAVYHNKPLSFSVTGRRVVLSLPENGKRRRKKSKGGGVRVPMPPAPFSEGDARREIDKGPPIPRWSFGGLPESRFGEQRAEAVERPWETQRGTRLPLAGQLVAADAGGTDLFGSWKGVEPSSPLPPMAPSFELSSRDVVVPQPPILSKEAAPTLPRPAVKTPAPENEEIWFVTDEK